MFCPVLCCFSPQQKQSPSWGFPYQGISSVGLLCNVTLYSLAPKCQDTFRVVTLILRSLDPYLEGSRKQHSANTCWNVASSSPDRRNSAIMALRKPCSRREQFLKGNQDILILRGCLHPWPRGKKTQGNISCITWQSLKLTKCSFGNAEQKQLLLELYLHLK